MEAFLASLVFVVLAEMGDKTQLLAMAFSCRYRWQTVMWGVLVATAANHLLAAALGNYLTTIVPLHWIKAAAAASFILFGLWTIRGDKLEGEDKRFAFSPFWTVTVAFFIAEMGDKTQLATVALAVEYNSIFSVWCGTTIGMLISNAIGIIVAVVMGRRIPERTIKWAASLIFMGFGVWGLYDTLPARVWSPAVVTAGLLLLATAAFMVQRLSARRGYQSIQEVASCELPGALASDPEMADIVPKASPVEIRRV
jgi:putative Ca2+/H+ antiporter (TMEM165/GDT1 family)